MKTACEKVAWVLRFTAMDLNALREGDWLNLREDIVAFVGWSQEDFPIWEPSEIGAFLTRSNIEETWQETKDFLGAIGNVNAHFLSALGRSSVPTGPSRMEQPTQTVQALGVIFSRGEPLRFYVRANLQESFRFALLTALLQMNYRRLLLCPSPCSRPFLQRHARQRFCSTLCKNRAALKSFRERKRQERAKKKAGQQPKRKSARKNQARVSAVR